MKSKHDILALVAKPPHPRQKKLLVENPQTKWWLSNNADKTNSDLHPPLKRHP
jgi:hypothetical protein